MEGLSLRWDPDCYFEPAHKLVGACTCARISLQVSTCRSRDEVLWSLPSTQPHSKCSKPRRTSYPANVTAWDRGKRAALKGTRLSGAARHPRLRQRCCFWSRWMCALTCTCIDTRACMQMKMQVCLLKIGECLTQPEVGRPAPPVSSVRQQR